MHFWPIFWIVVVIVGLVIWGIQSLNPHAFNAAAKTAAGNAEKGLAADASKAGSAVASGVSSAAQAVEKAAAPKPTP